MNEPVQILYMKPVDDLPLVPETQTALEFMKAQATRSAPTGVVAGIKFAAALRQQVKVIQKVKTSAGIQRSMKHFLTKNLSTFVPAEADPFISFLEVKHDALALLLHLYGEDISTQRFTPAQFGDPRLVTQE